MQCVLQTLVQPISCLIPVILPSSSLLRYGGNLSLQSAMSVRFNSNGTQLLALRRRLPPVLYDIHSRLPVFQFDNQGYFNSCTMKSCCFAGDRDQVSAFCLLYPSLLLSSQIAVSGLYSSLASCHIEPIEGKQYLGMFWLNREFLHQSCH